MLFEEPDRIPYRFGFPRESTLKAWSKQGFPRDADFAEFVGMDKWESLPMDLGPVPLSRRWFLRRPTVKIWIDRLEGQEAGFQAEPNAGVRHQVLARIPREEQGRFQAHG